MSSEYERLRLKNIADNKRILAELGLRNPFKALPKVIKKPVVFKRKRESSPVRVQKRAKTDDLENYGSVRADGQRRRSSRLRGKPASEEDELDESANGSVVEDEDDDDYGPRTPRVAPGRPNVYGAIPGVAVGTTWQTRMQCCADGVQRPTVAGIHMGPDGAYSLALSGGYEDDIDMGECFTYTGEGGRDLKGTRTNPKNLRTAPQSKDQVLQRGNLALTRSVETGNPVRVLRGYKLHSVFAPEEGYRYDGLYKVEKYWFTTGMSGFGVFKFALKRIEDQPPPPWTIRDEDGEGTDPDQTGNKDDLGGSQDSGLGSETPSETQSETPSETQSEAGSTKDHREQDVDDGSDSGAEQPKEKIQDGDQAEEKNETADTTTATADAAEDKNDEEASKTETEKLETAAEPDSSEKKADSQTEIEDIICDKENVETNNNNEKMDTKNDLNNNAETPVAENTV